MSTPPRASFDHCPNRTTEVFVDTRSICPRYPSGYRISPDVFAEDAERDHLALKLGCVACPMRHKLVNPERPGDPLEGYHPSIVEGCESKFLSGHYDDAVLTGILIVRDRMRDLTGYENAGDAFGRGGLIIAGSANAHTDNNFQEGSRFIMLANDRFRNELAHTNDQNDLIKNPQIALQFLGLSSISMFMLDSATATTPRS